MTEFNKVFCMAPWVHMNVNCNGDVYPCCMLPILETEEHDDTDKMLDGDGFNPDNPLEYIAGECDGSPREFKTGSLIGHDLGHLVRRFFRRPGLSRGVFYPLFP